MVTPEEVDKALDKYEERFNETFPIFHFTKSEEKINKMVEIINECLKTGKPYDLKLKRFNDKGKPLAY